MISRCVFISMSARRGKERNGSETEIDEALSFDRGGSETNHYTALRLSPQRKESTIYESIETEDELSI